MESDYEEIYLAFGLLDGETIRLFLQSFGIEAIVSQESAGVSMGLTVGPLGVARVFVHKADVEQAKQLIREMEMGQYQADDENQSQSEGSSSDEEPADDVEGQD